MLEQLIQEIRDMVRLWRMNQGREFLLLMLALIVLSMALGMRLLYIFR